MFQDSIDRLIKVRRYVDKQMVNIQEQPLLVARLNDVSYQLTMCINDLVMIQKQIEKEKQYESKKD